MRGLTVALGRLGRHSLSCSLSPDTQRSIFSAANHSLEALPSFPHSLFAFGPVLWVPWEHPPFWLRILPEGTRISKQRGSYETPGNQTGPAQVLASPMDLNAQTWTTVVKASVSSFLNEGFKMSGSWDIRGL